MKIAIITSSPELEKTKYSYGAGRDFERNVKEIAELGFDGVELMVQYPQKLKVGEMLEIAEKYGVEFSAIGTGIVYKKEGLSLSHPREKIRKATIERMKKHILLGSRLKCPLIIGSIRGKSWNLSQKEKAMNLLYASLKECTEYALERGVNLLIEPLSKKSTDLINNVREGIKLLKELNNSNLFLLLDTYHMNLEEKNIGEAILVAKNHLAYVHVVDTDRVTPGEGELNFKSILKTLQNMRYTGYLSLECYLEPNPKFLAQQAIKFLKSLIE
jgi:sugar phosphate isomerase/epimerase